MASEYDVPAGLHALSMGWQLFANSPDCVKLLSCDGRVLTMNNNGLCAMEIDRFAQVEGALWKSFWPVESHADIEAALADAIGGRTGHFKAFCPTAKGTPKWWDVIVTRIAGPERDQASLLVISRDITEAHRAQSALQASEARLRSLVTASSAIVWNANRGGLFDTEQPAWAGFTGQGFDQYRDAGWLDAVHPDDREATRAAWAQACASRSLCQTRHRLRRHDGIYRHMSVKGVPIFDAAGTLTEWMGVHSDITGEVDADAERERLLREVQAANARLNDIFRQAPAFMCTLRGPDHVLEMVNERYRQLVGNRDLIGQTVRHALPELDSQGLLEVLDSVYRSGEPAFGHDVAVMLQREPGMPLEERFLDLVYTPLRNAEDLVTGLLVHGVDQTHRKTAEVALHASRERFEKIVSQAATGVVEMDIGGRIRFVNQRYADMLGYGADELVGLDALAVTAPGSVRLTRDTINKVLADGDGAIIDKEYVRKDGTLMPATSSVNALRNHDGAFEGLVAIVLDTTDNARAAAELRASEERYRTLFESMDQGFCIIDMLFDDAGNPADYRFVEMNAMFEQHTGLAGGVGKTALELVPGLDRFWIDTYGRVARTGEAVRFENEVTAIARWFDVYATRIGGPDSNRVALLFSDISTRKKDSDTLRKLAADLSEADRRKTEFLATLAHELRNPLAPIRNGLSVMRLSEDKPAVAAKVRAMMERQVGHMVHLIDDLLDIARISGGKLQLKKTRAELGAVLASAIETSMPVIEAGHHALHVDVPAHGFGADIDVTRIAQVVANLLNNAAKYTPAGGRIALTLHREGAEAVLSVTDTGIGISADALAGVFDMFSQIGASIDRAQGGLGIGLSLVRRLVEMHGGSATAASGGAGLGSTFTVRLPLAADHLGPLPGAPAGAASADAAAGIKVLVVDDNVDAAMTLSMILELSGHTTRVAHNGLEAIEAVKDFTPQLAFLDIGMPRMNGYETAVALRRLPGLAGVNLVALTGWGADSDRNRSRDAGFDHHLTKPVQLSDIEHILAELDNGD
jgi:PAS domain S-box-containing protein